MMRILLRLMMMLMVAGCLAGAMGQNVPLEFRGTYSGKMKVTVYASGAPEKQVETVLMVVNENTIELTFLDSGPTVLSGGATSVGPYIFFQAMNPAISVGGRILVKGKPGKQSLSGKLTFGISSYLGIGDVTFKAKKLGM